MKPILNAKIDKLKIKTKNEMLKSQKHMEKH